MPHTNNGTLLHMIVKDGRIVDLCTDWLYHSCKVCPAPITPQEPHYSIRCSHSGLGAVNVPDRAHVRCLKKYFEGCDKC